MNQELLKMQTALDTLEHLGFTWEGGQQWKPPLGKAPYYLRDVPKYVTANLSNDTMCLIGDHLTHGKDYKVLNVTQDSFLVKDDKGVELWYNKSWFYSEQEEDVYYDEDEESFDDLVYVAPTEFGDSGYVAIKLSNLSENQINFLDKLVCRDENRIEMGLSKVFTMYGKDRRWFFYDEDSGNNLYISFNDIFVHKDSL